MTKLLMVTIISVLLAQNSFANQYTPVSKSENYRLKAISAFDRGDKDGMLKNITLSCKLDNAKGCYLVGALYRTGMGIVTISKPLALSYYKKSCDLGYYKGCDNYSKYSK